MIELFATWSAKAVVSTRRVLTLTSLEVIRSSMRSAIDISLAGRADTIAIVNVVFRR